MELVDEPMAFGLNVNPMGGRTPGSLMCPELMSVYDEASNQSEEDVEDEAAEGGEGDEGDEGDGEVVELVLEFPPKRAVGRVRRNSERIAVRASEVVV